MSTYFTLAPKGKAWLNNDALDPQKHKNVLASLAELIEENDVPRIAEQVARNTSIPEELADQGLKYLVSAGYVKVAKLPQPSEREQTSKLRIRPIEDLVAAEIRAVESQKRYAGSDKGKIVRTTYEGSDKGRTKNKRYRDSTQGKRTHKAYRLRRRLRELTNFLALHPEQESELQHLIIDVEARLANLKETNDNR